MSKERTRNIIKVVLKAGFTIAALWLVYKRVDLQALVGLWKRAHHWWLVPAVLLFVITQMIASLRLLVFFRNIKLPISVLTNMKLYLLGLFYNLFLPGGIGGDGYKVIALKKAYPETTHKEAFGAVFFDRLAGFWGMGFWMVIFSCFLPQLAVYRHWAIAGFLAGTGIYYLVMHRFFKVYSLRFLSSHGFAIASQLGQLGCIACILTALGYEGNMLPYFVIFQLSSVASLFPFSLGGLGAREVAIVWGATTLGLDKDLSVAISLGFYFITMLVSLTAVFILFNKNNLVRAEKPEA